MINFRQWLEAIEDERHPFKAVFMAGGPGSGKTFISKHMFPDFMQSNSDKVQELLFGTLPPGPPEFYYNLRRSQELSTQRCQRWSKQGLPIVIDTTARDSAIVRKINERLKSLGYDTGMVFVYSPLEKAIERNRKRSFEVQHVADEKYLIQAWHQAQENIPAYQEIFGSRFQELNNTEDYKRLVTRTDKESLDRRMLSVAHRVLHPPLSRADVIKRKQALCPQQIKPVQSQPLERV